MPQLPNPKDYKKLDTIADLLERRRYEEALELALELAQRRPKLVPAWEALADAAIHTQNDFLVWQATRQLCQLEPHEEIFWYNMGGISLNLRKLFLARQAVDTYLKRFPQGAHRAKVAQMHDLIEEAVQDLIDSAETSGNPDTDAWALFETGELFVTNGRLVEGRRYSLDAARRLPDNPSPLNNVSLSYMSEGDYQKALQMLEQVLVAFPDNLFAQASRVQVLLRLGRSEEAHPLLETIARANPHNLDHWHKLMETCAMAHEHLLLLDVYKRAAASFKSQSVPVSPALHLLAGSAQAFLGNTSAARKEWNSVPKSSREYAWAEDNLRDLKTHGPWYYPLSFWIPSTWAERIAGIYERLSHRSEDAAHREVARLLEKTPGMIATTSLLFERGDPAALEFALIIARACPLPGLVEFALGRRGADEARFMAAHIAADHGLLSRTEPVVLIQNGEPAEVLLMDMEIYTEPTGPELPNEAQDHLEAAHDAIAARDGVHALQEAEAALRIAPGNHTLINHQTNALRLLGRMDEADALVRALAEAEPDYLFARVAMADICTREKRFDEAHTWLKPLLTRHRFHISEFRALALMYIQLFVAMGQSTDAEMWLNLMDDVDPDGAPSEMKSTVSLINATSKLTRWNSRKK